VIRPADRWCVFDGGFVGIFYVPTVIAAGWVMAKRLDTSQGRAIPGFLDTGPQKGFIYTESEVEAMRNGQGQG